MITQGTWWIINTFNKKHCHTMAHINTWMNVLFDWQFIIIWPTLLYIRFIFSLIININSTIIWLSDRKKMYIHLRLKFWLVLSGSDQFWADSEQIWLVPSGFRVVLIGSDQFWADPIGTPGRQKSTECLERLRTVIVETSKNSSFKKCVSVKYI